MSPTAAPHGSWSSPITAELIVAGAAGLGEVWAEGDVVWWSELRPQEAGRVQLVRRTGDGTVSDVLPDGFSARTRVHEYGGGAWWVDRGVVFFVNWADQRLYRLDPGAAPVALTPEPQAAHGLRYADGRVTPDGRFVVCVRERHGADAGAEGVVLNEIVALSASAAGRVEVLASGRDFVSAPRISRDGRMVAWLTWDHPRMPWDGTELWIAHLTDLGDHLEVNGAHRVAGGLDESLVQPEWGRHGQLYVVSDRSDWWNVYRIDDPDVLVEVAPVGAEVGQAAWVFGQSRYGFTADGSVVQTWSEGGRARLGVAGAGGTLSVVELPFTSISSLRVADRVVTFVAAAATHEPVVARVDLDGGAAVEILRPCRDLGLDPALSSLAEPIEFASAGGRTAHAYFYPPTNPSFVAPDGERPPLLVLSHGGPTSAASSAFSLNVQFWTSRGFAVVDVDYGGSTGYGRAYRRLLDGAWGIVDVEDCCAAATALVEAGRVDPARLAIRGGSAGGFTTLAALAFTDRFAAGASHYGVADLAALARDTHKFEARYLDGLVGPWPAAGDVYTQRSPIHHTNGLTCPIIVFQGLEDEIVPPAQAEAMVAALAAKGIPHAYLAFEGEQHGFRQSASIVAALNAELYFYSRVFGFELAEAVPPIEIAFAETLR